MRPSLAQLLIAALLAASCTGGPVPLRAPGAVSAQREPVSLIVGDAPNFAASSNGDLLTVVSGPNGRGAKAGALVELYWPDMVDDNLWDAYSGVQYEGKFYWLHQFRLLSQQVLPDSDIVVSRFSSPDGRLEAELQDLVLRDRPVHMRQLKLTNRSAQPIKDLSVFFYAYFTAQVLPTGDACDYLPESGSMDHYQDKTHFVWGFDGPPAQFQCGGVKNFLTRAHDAMSDAEDGRLTGNSSAKAYIGLGVNEALAQPAISLAPGASHSSKVSIAAGSDRAMAQASLNAARGISFAAAASQNQAYWQQYLAQSTQPPGMDPEESAVYRRAQIVMKQHSVRTGAHLAAPTSTSPPYRFSWPRDGSF
ncbi:MAG: hypothetical protein ACAI44_39145, partial [Candidatus Sericytochromatia bacterium]